MLFLNFSFQRFHIICFTICLTSINQRGWKPVHGGNGFAPETSEGQFWLSSELCGVGLRSSMDNIVISLKPAIKWGFFFFCFMNLVTLSTQHAPLNALGCVFLTAALQWVCSSCCYCHGRNYHQSHLSIFIGRYFPMAVLWFGFLVSCFLSPPPTSLPFLLAYIPAQKFPPKQPV